MNASSRVNRLFIVSLPPLLLLVGLLFSVRRETAKAGFDAVPQAHGDGYDSNVLIRHDVMPLIDISPMQDGAYIGEPGDRISGRTPNHPTDFTTGDVGDLDFAARNVFDSNVTTKVATATVRCVHPTGDYGCYATIQAAIDTAVSGDVIRVAEGTYHAQEQAGWGWFTAFIQNKDLELSGGWAADFSARDPTIYVTTLDGEGVNSGIFLENSSFAVSGLHIVDGDSTSGAAILAFNSTGTIEDCTIFNNSGSDAGSVAIEDHSVVTMTNNTVSQNIHTSGSDGGGITVGGLSTATLISNVISHNAGGNGAALYVFAGSTATLINNEISHNSAASYGGGVFKRGNDPSAFTGNRVFSNTALYGGGIALYGLSGVDHSTFTDNWILSNTAERGGGLFLMSTDAAFDNNIIADNQASMRGAGLYLDGASPKFRHNTIANNKGGDATGIFVAGTSTRTLDLTNTILAGHSTGIVVSAGNNAVLEATLWGNDTNWSGPGTISIGSVNVWGDHDFVDPHNGDYHVGPKSAALDAGIDANLTSDIDGEIRPQGFTFDIGADERHCTAMTGVNIAGSTLGYTGATQIFTATAKPEDVSFPITYDWSATEQISSSGTAATIGYTWTVTGTKIVSVTAENCGGVFSANHTITIEVAISTRYLPMVAKNFTSGPLPPIEVVEAPDACPGYAARAGTSYRENFDFVNDNDWFAYDATSGKTYVIETGDLGASADTVLYLWTGDCRTQLAENDDRNVGDPSSLIEWTATATGPLAVMVRSYDWQVYGPETRYTLTIGEQ